ncbi:MAG: ABC transporter ATP-binding protein [Verrucomicrobiia bacterium]
MEYMVELLGIVKRFGSFTAISDVTLQIKPGEFMTFLGPSGCGKTTLLRMISGFDTPTEGRVLLAGEDVTFVPPHKRNVNQVFQSYALFPHLTVRENIEFGLKMQKVPKSEMIERVNSAVEIVALTGFEERKPSQLSGGQRQRVALARAIVCRPKVLLLDEPLSALDAKLRHSMQIELKRLQKKLGITFVFVTHDQEEALTMSDRIAIIHKGKIEQLGDATEIYHYPKTNFVANFIGQANILKARVLDREGVQGRVKLDEGTVLTVNMANLASNVEEALVSIRPEKIHLQKNKPQGENVMEVQIQEEIFKGAIDQMQLVTNSGLELTAVVANESMLDESFHKGEKLFCQFHPNDIVVVQDD